ncbi:unnamed protein product [Symbiodinium sp. CCMP2592]|nr:unnamed protein product [Symbiodinium sp. CCMP2592]
MASLPPQRSVSLAQSMNEATLDGTTTWEEAIGITDGMKIMTLDKPLVVNKPIGAIKIGDLPAKDEIVDSMNKKVQFLEVLMDYEGDLDLKIIETLFKQQRYSDLPEPIKMKGNNLHPYTMQLFLLPKGANKWDIVKHVRFADGTRMMSSTIKTMCTGRPLEINYQKNFREGSRALQYLLEGLGGFQVRYHQLVPGNASTKPVKETEDIRKGFTFLKEHGPQENSNGEFTSWTEEQVNDPNGPLFRWDRGTIKEYLRCLADKGSQAKTIADWPLTLVDFTPWAINLVIAPVLPYVIESGVIWIGKSYVGKSPLSYTLAKVLSAYWLLQEGRDDQGPTFQTANHLDYFRKEMGRRTKPRVYDDGNLPTELPASVKAILEVSGVDRKTMARYNASSYEKNQFCQVCSNPYDHQAAKPMDKNVSSDQVDFKTFYDLVRTQQAPVKRHAWPSDDLGMVSPCARPIFDAYKKGNLSKLPPNHSVNLQWSLNLLQAALDGEAVGRCYTVMQKDFSGKKVVRECRPELANIDATTVFYPDLCQDAPASLPAKRLKSVRSSNALLTNETSHDEHHHDEDKPKQVFISVAFSEIEGPIAKDICNFCRSAPGSEMDIASPIRDPMDDLSQELDALVAEELAKDDHQ